MLHSIRLLTIALSITILSTLAPVAAASPISGADTSLDLMAKIEALFSSLENIIFSWVASEEPALNGTNLDAQFDNYQGTYDPNGVASEFPEKEALEPIAESQDPESSN